MLYKRRNGHEALCVLQVDVAVIDLPLVVITDQNAASDYARFEAAPGGLRIVNRARTFADDWRHPDQIEYWRHKAAKCAEVLVPDFVDQRHIRSGYVSCEAASAAFDALGSGLEVTISQHMFFM
jgi:hypothetical protein